MVTFDDTNISTMIDQSTRFGGEVTGGLVQHGDDLGSALGTIVVVSLFVFLILLVLGIPQKIINLIIGFITSIRKKV